MAPTIRLGRLFGIEIGFNWSLLFIFALIAWSLASSMLPADVPGQSAQAYWSAGIAGAVAFYACLLAHELSHALMARRKGVRVAGITLWLFGGVSQLESEPETAGAEALITVVGPATSFVMSALAFAGGLVCEAWRGPALLRELLGWLFILNLALGLFNLVPAFPLDGGRLLSSLFWWRTGSRGRGVHYAVLVGRVFAYLMIVGGVVELLGGAVVNGVWIVFIGWFLLSAASAEDAGVMAKALLRSVPVSAAMSSPVITVPDWLTVESFLVSAAHQYHFTTYPLHDPAGNLTGVVQLRELLRVPVDERAERRLRECARPLDQLPTARPDEDLARVMEKAGVARAQRVLVFDGGQLVGIVSSSDVARVLMARQSIAAGPRRP